MSKMRKQQKHEAYRLVLSNAEVCINCIHARPNPISECNLIVVCMNKPFKRYRTWKDLPYYFGFSRGRLYKSLRNYRGGCGPCSKFEPRKNATVFLRLVLWIKRLVWHLMESRCLLCSSEHTCVFSHTIHALECKRNEEWKRNLQALRRSFESKLSLY